jgi:hypothetical protein
MDLNKIKNRQECRVIFQALQQLVRDHHKEGKKGILLITAGWCPPGISNEGIRGRVSLIYYRAEVPYAKRAVTRRLAAKAPV